MERIVCLLLVSGLFLFSCSRSEDKTDEKTLLLSEKSVEFTSEGGNHEIVITTNTNWNFFCGADWIEVETTEKKESSIILIRAKPNQTTVERTASIVVAASAFGINEEIVITQEANYFAGVGTATVLGKGSDCGTFLIHFDESVSGLPVPSSFFNNVYYTVNLPEECKKEGERINVEFRAPKTEELMAACTAMGPAYPHIFIIMAYSCSGVVDLKIGEITEIKLFETAYNPQYDLQLRIENINDSRCPIGVNCIWEGNATVQFYLTTKSQEYSFTLDTHQGAAFKRDTIIEGMKYQLMNVLPYPSVWEKRINTVKIFVIDEIE